MISKLLLLLTVFTSLRVDAFVAKKSTKVTPPRTKRKKSTRVFIWNKGKS